MRCLHPSLLGMAMAIGMATAEPIRPLNIMTRGGAIPPPLKNFQGMGHGRSGWASHQQRRANQKRNRAEAARNRDPQHARAQTAINQLTNRERTNMSRAHAKRGGGRLTDIAFIESFDVSKQLAKMMASRSAADAA